MKQRGSEAFEFTSLIRKPRNSKLLNTEYYKSCHNGSVQAIVKLNETHPFVVLDA